MKKFYAMKKLKGKQLWIASYCLLKKTKGINKYSKPDILWENTGEKKLSKHDQKGPTKNWATHKKLKDLD